jgi:hypothetical protein
MQFPRYTVDLLWAEATNRLVLVLYAETTNSVHGGLFFLFITQSIFLLARTSSEAISSLGHSEGCLSTFTQFPSRTLGNSTIGASIHAVTTKASSISQVMKR